MTQIISPVRWRDLDGEHDLPERAAIVLDLGDGEKLEVCIHGRHVDVMSVNGVIVIKPFTEKAIQIYVEE